MECGSISAPEMDHWISSLLNASREGLFFSATVGFMVCGVKPAAAV
jgi:hypothetical protein